MNAKAAPAPAHDRAVLTRLEGVILDGGWRIGTHLPKTDGQTGGFFSEGYECSHQDGTRAFLKAVDLFEALNAADTINALNTLTDGVRCEIELLEVCKRMDRVVSALAFGYIRELSGQRLAIPIPYIIFERADGSIRSIVHAAVAPPAEWKLRTLHHVTTGLMQLHRRRIAHQDLKLSNTLHYENQKVMKIADLGRSIQQDRAVYYDQFPWPGDPSYAPPEVAYGFAQSEFNTRRLAADMYLLGNFACNLLTGVQLNALLYNYLDVDLKPPLYRGPYSGTFENIVVHLQDAFSRVMEDVEACIDADAPYKEELIAFIRQWANPDIRERGHPRTRAINATNGNIYDLERYASSLANMVLHASVHARRNRA